MIKILTTVLFFFISIILSIIWTYENPEKIEAIKNFFEKKSRSEVSIPTEDSRLITANSFNIKIQKILDLNEKTSFIIHPKNENFKLENLLIYTQKGDFIKNLQTQKLNLPKYFTLQRNGGVKTIIFTKEAVFALISGREDDCFFAALIDVDTAFEYFKSQCLPEEASNNDFNGLGSSNIHVKDKILFSLGTPEKHASKNSLLAQNDQSRFGKILEIQKDKIVKNKNFSVDIFSKGHRVPQGLTILNDKIFSVEHGPKGGDELNLIIKGNNYGWPIVSYGTNYMKENGGDGSAYKVNHEKNNFIEPLFAFVPSVGISSLNKCPLVLAEYYKKPCLLALSLYGNDLRKGHSIIIFLLNDDLNKVHSIEKIRLGNLALRHFVTDNKNQLYENEKGEIFISADKEGLFKLNFFNFR